MIAAQTPTIAKIKNKLSLTECRALLSIAICELCDFFNVGKSMNDFQIAITVDLIIEEYWYLKLEEIKYCFHRAMMREKLFDRIDGNIILGWLREYDNERTEEAIRISENRDSRTINECKKTPNTIGYKEYLANLEQRAKHDKCAAELLEQIKNPPPQRFALLSRDERAQKDHDFKLWKQFDYLLKNNK